MAILIEQEIVLLREFRSRLITGIVTGKLDVRAAASSLPETVEEPELIDEPEMMDVLEDSDQDDPELAEAAA